MKTEKGIFLKRVGKGLCEHISKCLPLRAKKRIVTKPRRICAVEEGKPWQQNTGGIKIGTLILGSACEWTSQCDRQDG